MLGPMEIIMRVATRLGDAIDGMDTEAQLDAMIAKAEQHGDVGADRLTADPKSLRRTPFAAHIPFRQQAMAQMSWRDLRRILRNAPRMKRQTSRGEMFYNKTFSPARRTLSPRERADLVAFMKSRGADEWAFCQMSTPASFSPKRRCPNGMRLSLRSGWTGMPWRPHHPTPALPPCQSAGMLTMQMGQF